MARKSTVKQTKKPAKKKGNAITRFFRETTGELRRVSWPTWKEARSLTIVVVLVMIVMALYLGGMDFIFFEFFEFLFDL